MIEIEKLIEEINQETVFFAVKKQLEKNDKKFVDKLNNLIKNILKSSRITTKKRG